MIKGLGIDLVEIARIEKILIKWGNHFLKKVFTTAEIDYCQGKEHPFPHFAARFAAKEAVFKMLSTRNTGISWQDIEIKNTIEGIPQVNLRGKALEICEQKEIKNIYISISHERNYAVVQVIGEG